MPPPPDPTPSSNPLQQAIKIMARLRAPDGCLWDLAQTFDTIKPHTLEETYEVFDAIDRRDWPHLKEELGDLLLQVLFYAQMASEAGYFTIEDVAATLNAKLIRRHPHIFGDTVATTPEAVKQNWDAIKRQEKADRLQQHAGSGAASPRMMDEVPRHEPALQEARKLGKKAASVGFDWPDTHGLIAKLHEETKELAAEIEPGQIHRDAAEDELGDLLFTTVNLARHLKLEPEFALRKANQKFRARFNILEATAGGPEALRLLSPDEFEERWQQAKASLNHPSERPRAEVYSAASGSLPDSSSPEPE